MCAHGRTPSGWARSAGVELTRPFIHLTKAQIAARGAELGVDFCQNVVVLRGWRGPLRRVRDVRGA